MELKAIIVDDEKWNRANLQALLKDNCPNVKVLAEAVSADEAIELLTVNKIDLLFLDIEMPNKSGLELLKEMGEVDFEVIFCTAHSQYALKAFKFNAVDYLLKPIDENELITAVKQAEENRKQKKAGSIDIESLMQAINTPEKKFEKLAVHVAEGIKFLKIEDIIRCESDGNYTTIYQKDKEKLVVAKSLKEYELILTEYGFFRIHNYHLINMAHIKNYRKEDGGYVTLADDSRLEISRRRKDAFLELVNRQFL